MDTCAHTVRQLVLFDHRAAREAWLVAAWDPAVICACFAAGWAMNYGCSGTLWRDLVILIETPRAVLRGNRAY